MVEYVVDFPPQLDFALFPEPEVLKKRYVVIKDGGKTQKISRHIANLKSAGLGNAGRIDRVGRPGRILRTNQLVWIAKNNATRIYFATAKVSRRRSSTGCRFCGRVRRRLNESRGAGVSQNYRVRASAIAPIQ